MTIKELEKKYGADYTIIYYGKYNNGLKTAEEYSKNYPPFCNSSIFPKSKREWSKMIVLDYTIKEHEFESIELAITSSGLKGKGKKIMKGEIYALITTPERSDEI